MEWVRVWNGGGWVWVVLWVVAVVEVSGQVAQCTCRYNSTESCACGSPCETTVPVANCSSDDVLCKTFCRGKGFDVCNPANCQCRGCAGTVETLTAIDSASCQEKCVEAGCGNFSYVEDVFSGCQGQGADVTQQTAGPRYCFSGDGIVELRNGRRKMMHELEIGDVIRSSGEEFSEVFAFTHRDEDGIALFLELRLSNGESLTISHGHYVHAGPGILKAAENAFHLQFWNESGTLEEVAVSSVSLRRARGIYNPQTLSGDIVVNGVSCSTYTRAVHPLLASILLAPPRLAYRLGFKYGLGTLFDTERREFLGLPKGPERVS